MADFVFNIAKGRVAEFVKRVDDNDPAPSALVALVLATSGLESDAVLKDKDDVSALVSGTTNEVTNTGYSRITLTDSDLAWVGQNDTADTMETPQLTLAFGAITAGDGWSKLVIAYDADTGAGTDANLIPLTAHDITITPDGSAITLVSAAAGFFGAS